MDLNEFSRQLESMHARFMQLCPTNGAERGDLRSMWEETSEALGVTVEELRVAEEELRQQTDELEESRQTIEAERRRYQDLFDFAPDGYLVTDLAGMIREANRAAGELLGVAPHYLARKPLASYIALDDRAAFRGGLNRLLRVGRREDWIVRVEPRRGGAFDAAITVAVVRDGEGAPSSLRWMFREVTGGIAASRGGASRRGGRVTIGLTGPVPPDELARAPGPHPRRGRGRGVARALAGRQPDRLGGRRGDRPVLVHQPPGRAVPGLPGVVLAGRAGFLGRDHPRRGSADGRGASGPLRPRWPGRRGGIPHGRGRRPRHLVPRVAGRRGRRRGAAAGDPRLPLGDRPPQEGRAAALHGSGQAGRAPGRRPAPVPPGRSPADDARPGAGARGGPRGGDLDPGRRDGGDPAAGSRPRRVGGRGQPGPVDGLPGAVRPHAGRRRGLRPGHRAGRAGDRGGRRGRGGPHGRRELGRAVTSGGVPGLFQRPAGHPQWRSAGHDRHLLPRAAPADGPAAPDDRAVRPPGRRRHR